MPLAEILTWPAWHLDAYRAFIEREIPPLQRIEMILAQLMARVHNATRAQDASAVSFSDFLLPRDTWAVPTEPVPAAADPPVTAGGLTPEELRLIGCLDGAP